MARHGYDPSLDRQRLDRLAKELSEILQAFCGHDRLLRGRLRRLRRRCGKAPCRCQRGALHESLVFVDPGPPKRTIRKVTRGQYQDLRKPVKRYRSLRRLRARLGQLHHEVLACCDRLSAWRLKEGRRALEHRLP